ncbi:uncharacterized protein PGTG_03186 [Puccinia graminis f. sp. tritici CRL 75-36-700-3]|uniref:Uncharacterized protein n=1 Tax=Puccinia graminis f. sp. tritici (strain CRL 75-36-700-3 / race SCCL) TaxID=418459 RepID=E3JYV5_PUCGT|nr:uncharacterized protein PGTG_03186 [Puccinia graminis f. sp. tritici CRL 75-36-700-3]EFP77230.2 hypothetical protein PGTG_03186 [Puccinia graminis f. sp. tritici CRL 75-36-700-3]
MEPISAHAPLDENASKITLPLSGFHFEDYNPFGLAEFAADDEWFKLGDVPLYFESFPSLPAEARAKEPKSLDNQHFTQDINSPLKHGTRNPGVIL